MCKPNNQTIYRECYKAALRLLEQKKADNQTLQRLLKEHGGCLSTHGVLDRKAGVEYRIS